LSYTYKQLTYMLRQILILILINM